MYIHSTISCSIAFDINGRRFVVHGGANVTTKQLWTPRGIATSATKEEVDELRKNPSFRRYEKNGFLLVTLIERNADNAAKDMEPGDNSAQKDLAKIEKDTKATAKK